MKKESDTIESLVRATRRGKRYKYLFFWGHHKKKDGQIGKECLSQWWNASFTLDGIQYPSAEVYMMAEKARLFHDHAMEEKILSASHPGAAKHYGRAIRNFSPAVWNANRFAIVVRGNTAKFQQNQALQDFLVRTADRVLVEASPVDSIWGIGLAEDHPHAKNPEQWPGLNLLGFALMHVRSLLRTS